MRIFENKFLTVALSALLSVAAFVPAAQARDRNVAVRPGQLIRVTPFVCDYDDDPSIYTSNFVNVLETNSRGFPISRNLVLQIDTTGDTDTGDDALAGAVIDGIAGLSLTSVQWDVVGSCGDIDNFGPVIFALGNDAFGFEQVGFAFCDDPANFTVLSNYLAGVPFTREVWTPDFFFFPTFPDFEGNPITQLTGLLICEQFAPTITILDNIKVNNSISTKITGVTLGCQFPFGANPFEVYGDDEDDDDAAAAK